MATTVNYDSPVDPSNIEVMAWYFDPNGIVAHGSQRLFVRDDLMVKNELLTTENVSEPSPGYPDVDRTDILYHNYAKHGSGSPGLRIEF